MSTYIPFGKRKPEPQVHGLEPGSWFNVELSTAMDMTGKTEAQLRADPTLRFEEWKE